MDHEMINQVLILNNKINDVELRVRKVEVSLKKIDDELKKVKGYNIKISSSLKNIRDDIDYGQGEKLNGEV